jgi:hypothetical protein
MLERRGKLRRKAPMGHQDHADHVGFPLMEPAAGKARIEDQAGIA